MNDLANTRILVVDDNEANRALAKGTLEDEGANVLLASGGHEALALFQEKHPDCIVLDIRMPDLDGFAVATRIRALPGGADVPILFFTALRDVDTFDHALRAGGDDFLTKPVSPAELVVRVHTALKLRRLGAEVTGQYEQMKRQRDDLMRMQLQKERLVAFIVHDLKNPLNTLDLHAQVVLREKNIDESVRDSVQQIRAQVRQLSRMIMNILDVSKADEGQLAPKPTTIELPKLVAAVLEDLGPAASTREVKLERSIDAPTIVADEDLLRRTVTNLAENALRYAPRGSSVHVTARPTANGTEIRVADEGRGVPPAMREKVFEPFVQVEGDGGPIRTSRGLGLSFCKRAVEAQGGHIWVEDGAPGAIFCFELPS